MEDRFKSVDKSLADTIILQCVWDSPLFVNECVFGGVVALCEIIDLLRELYKTLIIECSVKGTHRWMNITNPIPKKRCLP